MAGKLRISRSERSLDQVIRVAFILLEEFVEFCQRLFEVTQSRISVLRNGIEVSKLLAFSGSEVDIEYQHAACLEAIRPGVEALYRACFAVTGLEYQTALRRQPRDLIVGLSRGIGEESRSTTLIDDAGPQIETELNLPASVAQIADFYPLRHRPLLRR